MPLSGMIYWAELRDPSGFSNRLPGFMKKQANTKNALRVLRMVFLKICSRLITPALLGATV